MEFQKLIEAFRQRERRALSRALSLAENAGPGFGKFFDELHATMAGSCRIGVTGPPGAGKSTLLSVMLGSLSKRGVSSGVLAVDPSSPFTGGAWLNTVSIQRSSSVPWRAEGPWAGSRGRRWRLAI